MSDLDAIFKSDLSEMEKLAQAFGWITNHIVEHADQEIELARAMQDGESVVKQQIKRESFRSARNIFQMCYLRATGRRAWDE